MSSEIHSVAIIVLTELMLFLPRRIRSSPSVIEAPTFTNHSAMALLDAPAQ
jgi:hypothetical protein